MQLALSGAVNRVLCAIIMAAVTCLATTGLHADCNPQFKQVTKAGLGDPNNLYIHSMANFGHNIYFGTFNRVTGAQIWRFDGNSNTQVMDGGFGRVTTESVRALVVFGGRLYAGTYDETSGPMIWRTADGTTWQNVTDPGFGAPPLMSARGTAVFNGYLYVGFQAIDDNGPGHLWRTADGTHWEPITTDSFGDPATNSIHFLAVHGGQLYAGGRTSGGTHIWRSTDGVNFEQVVGPNAATPSGFGNPENTVVFAMDSFKGKLYVTVTNWTQGFSLYRTSDGINYEQVGTQGFGTSTNAYGWRFQQYEGALWLGVMNNDVARHGARLWRTFDGDNWEEMVGPTSPYIGEGFGKVRNWGIRTMTMYDGTLFIGTAQCFYDQCQSFVKGGEVWIWPGEICDQ